MDEDRDFKLPVGSGLETSEDATGNTAAASPDARADNATAEQEPRVKFEAPPSPGQPEDRDEATRLRELNAQVRDQDDLERGINQEAERLLNEQAHERDRKRLERAILDKTKVESQLLRLHQRMSQPIGTGARVRLDTEIRRLENRLSELETDVQQIKQRIEDRTAELENAAQITGDGRLPNESRRDYLIRTGKITPFSRIGGREPVEDRMASLSNALIDAEEEKEEEIAMEKIGTQPEPSHRHLKLPGQEFEEEAEEAPQTVPVERAPKRRRITSDRNTYKGRYPPSDEEYVDDPTLSGAEPMSDESYEEYSEEEAKKLTTKGKKAGKKARGTAEGDGVEDLRGVDDGDEKIYKKRLDNWIKRRSEARKRAQASGQCPQADPVSVPQDLTEAEAQDAEWLLPHPKTPDFVLDGGFHVPGDIYPYLFDYQKTGVQWLWELHQQKVGGIVGDEMGLGKTIQVIAFLASLHHSGMLNAPVIVVCPPTVMKQWVNEFHQWWPPLRVSILHTSGSGMINVRNETFEEDRLSHQVWDPDRTVNPRGYQSARKIMNRVLRDGHVLVTTYAGLQTYANLLIPIDWGAAILDEGHKIRNPDTAITLHCKELRTPHRIILSGTPMQNNLTELWSLFDFVFPMRLGTLVNFRNQFDFPIRVGGYANASNLQVQTAAKCAETLKDAISPYLLQRFKVDVAADLPKKSEQVLFCKLTKVQRKAYEAFLGSPDMVAILNGRREVLFGVDILRKICNHPDLPEHRTLSQRTDYDYGNGTRSGKMQVVKSLLELWRDTGHKTLLFAQHRIMLDILEKFVKSIPGIESRRMDGNTPIKTRQTMVDEFNDNPDIHLFLLTTKVGGLGVNLTGADRVIIYDPDWNPSTDLQARERAWRLGQKREVTIYRLMTAGTIEEKIYHRQIFKQFLTNKILKDPKQRQTFQMSDLYDLFTLGNEGPTQTSEMFKEAQVKWHQGQDGQTEPSQERDTEAQEAKVKEEDDVRNVAGVSGLEAFQGAEAEAESKSAAPEQNSENRLMQGIFARSGVHSALEHEQIVGGKRVIRADPKIIEAEAKRVAAEAAKELQEAEKVARTVPAGTPTWTGTFGSAGRPDDSPSGVHAFGGSTSSVRRGGGPSSSSLLANLASKNRSKSSSKSSTPVGSRAGTPAALGPSTNRPQGKDFLVMIRDYIIAHGGAVYTQMLIDHFNRYCESPKATAEFKEMLREIAVLDKTGSRARGKWVLKPQYAAKK